MGHENVDMLHEGYKAFQNNDLETLDRLFADDITWHSYGESPFRGEYHGKEEVFGLFATIPEETDEFDQTIHDILANDEHGVALVEQSLTVDGRSFDGRAVHVMHIDDGTVTEVWIQPVDQAASDAFWAEVG